MTKVIAHRGFSSQYPENTLIAFQKAIECGAHMIELDLQMTIDQKLVVFHDSDLPRTTNGRGYVEKLTLETIRSYDAGSWFSPEFHEEKAPTLTEVLDLCGDKIEINVEIKATENWDILTEFEASLESRIPKPKILVSSFDIKLLVELMNRNPNRQCAYAFLDNEYLDRLYAKDSDTTFDFEVKHLSLFEHIERAASLKFSEINFRWSVLSPAVVRYAHKLGLAVNCWTVDDKDDLTKLVNMGVDGIITNCPHRLLEILG